MRLAILVLSSLVALGLLASSSSTSPGASSAAPAAAKAADAEAGTFAVDPTHSNVLFKVMHNHAAWFYGRFAEMSGSFEYHPDDPSACSLSMEIPAESVDTRNQKLDQHLRSPDFLDAKQFPAITFESKEVSSDTPGMYQVTGDLTLRGVTKEITVDVEHVGTSSGPRGTVMGFHTRFVVDRTDYGVSYAAGGPLGSQVEMIVSIEAGEN